MCSIASAYVADAPLGYRRYNAAMQPEQKIIAQWMRRQMKRLGWKPQQWAAAAEISPTNITRAIKDDFTSVSSVRTLALLAQAAKVPSILDFLERDGDMSLSVSSLATLLRLFLRHGPPGGYAEEDAERLAEAVVHGLRVSVTDPTNQPSLEAIGVAARASIERFLS